MAIKLFVVYNTYRDKEYYATPKWQKPGHDRPDGVCPGLGPTAR